MTVENALYLQLILLVSLIVAGIVVKLAYVSRAKRHVIELEAKTAIGRDVRKILREHEEAEPGAYVAYMRSSAGQQMRMDEVSLILARSHKRLSRGNCLDVAPLIVSRLDLIDRREG